MHRHPCQKNMAEKREHSDHEGFPPGPVIRLPEFFLNMVVTTKAMTANRVLAGLRRGG